ncbi:hypothetical protein [Roseobacter sp. GAI101]|uniref:hypothetical protein n=1 Tax=Roseobacter sp. (strain GAI101) TaxID=391589 RepID=UPI0001871C85|nr:hypothetical protein [Roseobacter sp. GAI101]EEB82799.1 hypothetical protein RGAI101_4104 [Roseobacter sp. GAI101]
MHKFNTDMETQSTGNVGYRHRITPKHSGYDCASVSRLPARSFDVEIHDAFGPDPVTVLQCFIALGLSDGEIARYVGLPEARVNSIARPLRAPDIGKYLE